MDQYTYSTFRVEPTKIGISGDGNLGVYIYIYIFIGVINQSFLRPWEEEEHHSILGKRENEFFGRDCNGCLLLLLYGT